MFTEDNIFLTLNILSLIMSCISLIISYRLGKWLRRVDEVYKNYQSPSDMRF